MQTRFIPGEWNVCCDVCGFRFKASQIRKRWDGLMVCSKDFEYDHPQKYLRVPEETQTVPFVREENDSQPYVCYLWGVSGYAGLAEAGCAKANNTQFTYTFLNNLKNEGTTT